MITRVYIAGRWEGNQRIHNMGRALQATTFQTWRVVSTWTVAEAAVGSATEQIERNRGVHKTAEDCAKRDLAEVLLCDVFVVDTLDDDDRGGREVECGAALALGKVLIVVGPKRNVFHSLASYHYPGWQEFLGRWDRDFNEEVQGC